LDNSIDNNKRLSAYEIFDSLGYSEKFNDIIFELLETIKDQKKKNDDFSSVDILFREIIQNIRLYFEINPLSCKQRLWKAYDLQIDKKIKNRILFLINSMSLGKEHYPIRDIRSKYIYKFVKQKSKE